MKQSLLSLVFLGVLLIPAEGLRAETYTLRSTPLREAARDGARVVVTLDANETVRPLGPSVGLGWTRLKVGRFEGFVRREALSDRRLEVHKQERELWVWDGNTVVRRFRVALGAQAPVGDKHRQGDRATPEGRFFLAELNAAPQADRYGARSMLLSYPSAVHAQRGLRAGLVRLPAYQSIVRQLQAGLVPDQKTALGGSIRIHGGGSQNDWTLGCVALLDAEVTELYAMIGLGTRVDVFGNAVQAEAAGQPLGPQIAKGAAAQLRKPALYSEFAMGYSTLAYPQGDIDPAHAVCSDIVIRALRPAGIDLQALVYEDRLRRPKAYAGAANWSIDHRRVRNLVTFLERWAAVVDSQRPSDFEPGDVVVFDTGISNGTRYDHVGVVGVSERPGMPPVTNIWAPGARTKPMDLLGQDYPTVAAHFRLMVP